MPRIPKGLAVALSIFAFFCLMSKIDSIVHRTLYDYDLRFSYQWASEHWLTYNATFVSFLLIIALMYWLGSNKTPEDLKVSAGLSATVIILAVGGLQDILFYTLWGMACCLTTWSGGGYVGTAYSAYGLAQCKSL